MSEDDYLSSLGLGSVVSDYTLDTVRLPHGETLRQRRKRLEASQAAATAHFDARDEARKEYERLVNSGEVRPPTRIESYMRTANGHPDNQSTQAARRMLEKRGYDWRTGRKL